MEEASTPHPLKPARKSICGKAYTWLVKQKAFSGIVGSVLFPVILVPLFVWMTRYADDHFNRTEEDVCINVPLELDGYDFRLRFVREGTSASQGPLFDADYGFQKINGSRTRCASFTHRKHYGAQFKPFMVKNGQLTFDQAKQLLTKAGYDKNNITPDCWDPNNVWFLLQTSAGYGVIQDVGNPLPLVAFQTSGANSCIPGQSPGRSNSPSGSIILNNFSPK